MVRLLIVFWLKIYKYKDGIATMVFERQDPDYCE